MNETTNMDPKTCDRCGQEYSPLADFCQACYDRKTATVAIGFVVSTVVVLVVLILHLAGKFAGA